MNNLLEEIQTEAISSIYPLTDLLRKCRVLSQRIGSEELKSWAICELDGYPSGMELPDYRILDKVPVKGDLSGFGGSFIRNCEIPRMSIHEEFRDQFTSNNLRQGVAELMNLAQKAEDGNVHFLIPAEACHFIDQNFARKDFRLYALRQQLPVTVLHGVLDTIRTRILNFCLELQDLAAASGNGLNKLKEDMKEQVHQQFINNIHGSVGNLAQGDHASQFATLSLKKTETLEALLADLGIQEREAKELVGAVTAERPDSSGELGPRTIELLKKIGSGTLKVSSGVATNLISAAIRQYYRLP